MEAWDPWYFTSLPGLKREFCGELENPWIPGALDQSKGRRRQPAHGSAEVRMVQYVEKFETQLESQAFANREFPCEVCIHIEVRRRDQRIPACVAICAGSIRRERLGVDPNQTVGIPHIRASYHVGPVLPDSG